MAETTCNLYRSVMGGDFKIKSGIYPGDGVLDPRWESKTYFSKRLGKDVTSRADVEVVMGSDGPEVLPGGGTSLHDVSGWFPTSEFWIPEGTVYSDELVLVKDKKVKTCPTNPNIKGHHYQIECKTRMTIVQMQGYLNNMTRAAIVRQCELAREKIDN